MDTKVTEAPLALPEQPTAVEVAQGEFLEPRLAPAWPLRLTLLIPLLGKKIPPNALPSAPWLTFREQTRVNFGERQRGSGTPGR